MTKFEEMRLRAIKFQDLLSYNIGIEITGKVGGTALVWIAGDEFASSGDLFYVRSYREADDSKFHKEITEAEWVSKIESEFNARFPSLLEAQGWIAVENALPEPDQWTQIRIVNWNEVNIGTSRYFESSEKGKWFLGVQWKYSNDTCIEVRTEHLRVTHWKPLDIFPEPFEPSNV